MRISSITVAGLSLSLVCGCLPEVTFIDCTRGASPQCDVTLRDATEVVDGPAPTDTSTADASVGDAASDVSADVASDGSTDTARDVSTDACADGGCTRTTPSCATAGTPGCGVVEIAGGTFTMGAPDGAPSECASARPRQPSITVGAFAIDAYEVTVARFRRFWTARAADGGASLRASPVRYPGGQMIAWDGPGMEPDISTDGFGACTWSRTAGSREDLPINCVQWTTAQEFCVFNGGRLPTEAEWEFVATGRAVSSEELVSGRVYPWGNDGTDPCSRANVAMCAADARVQRVGAFPASGGIFDLTGNVAEWMADYFGPYDASTCWSASPQSNPLCLAPSNSRSRRSSSFNEPSGCAAARSASPTNVTYAEVGFRCAYSR